MTRAVTRVVMVSCGPHLHDNTLWLHMLGRLSDALVVVPGAARIEWPKSKDVRDRVIPVRSIRLGSDTATWRPGLIRLVEEYAPDVVHLDDEPWSLTSQALVRRGIPTVVHSAENVIADAPWPYRVRRTGLGRTLRSVSGVAAWGQTTLNALWDAGLPAATPTALLPARPPSDEVFHPRARRSFDGVLRVGFAGRLVKEKGVDVAIRAVNAAGSGHAVLHVMGSGPEQASLERLAGEGAVKVVFHPASGARRVADYIADMDVMVAPSRRGRIWREQWCRVAVEAMMMGRPVLASDSGEMPRTVGVPEWIFPEDDHLALAALIAGFNEGTGLDVAGERAIESASRFRIDLVGKELEDLWAHVTGRGGA